MSGNNTDNLVYNVNKISKKTFLLALTAFTTGFLILVFYWLLGLTQTTVMLVVYCISIGIFIFLNHKNIINNTRLPFILFVSFALIVFAAEEGFGTGQYLYYFPLLFAIPVVVDHRKTYNKKIIIYFSITAICCFACILVGKFHRPWEPISAVNQNLIFYLNAFSAIILTIGFAYINITLERNYLNELIDQKNHIINARTQFLSTMGHELRTPLNGIIGAINLLKSGNALPEQQEYFEILKYCSDHMLHQVNDILDFSKIEAGKLEIHPVEVNLKQLIVASTIPFESFFRQKNIELKTDIDPTLDLTVMADDVRLIQLFNNLLSNAGKFTSVGYIKVSAQVINKTAGTIAVKFSVEDTGTGIAEKDQKHVFNTYGQVFDKNTRNYAGSGLGLTICMQILELMDSKMELKSAKGDGSTFSFAVSFDYNPQQLQEEQLMDQEKDDLANMKILLVEDNQINMIIANKILTGFKASCTKAYNGKEALAFLEENHDFQIILMDLEMPVMDGYATIKEINKIWPHLPVLAFTATLLDVEKLEEIKKAGFRDCILKPFQAPVLLSQIKKYALEPILLNA